MAKVKIGDFLFERKGRYKPNDKAIQGLKRIEKIDFSGKFHIGDKSSKTNMVLVKKGDLVISGINVAKGAMGIYTGNEDVVATIHYSSYTFDETKINVDYFKRFLKSKEFIRLLKEQIKGGIKTEIKPKHLLPLEIELPDLEKQNEIVSKFEAIEEDMAALDKEIQTQQTLLKKLRQAILQEAIEGKLTADWRAAHPDIEPASALLEKIRAEKERLVKEKKIRKQKSIPPIEEGEVPFEIPESWEWCRLGDILNQLLGGYAYKSPMFKTEGKNQVLRLGNIRPAQIRLNEKPVFISNELANETSNWELKTGDILITMTGTRGKRDYCYTVMLKENDFENRRLFVNQRVGCFRFNSHILNSFYDFALKTTPLLDQIYKTATGSANQANIGSTALNNWIVPLPPLEEQKEIVKKIKNLFTLCDALEAQIDQSKSDSEALMQAVLREAFENA